jgi:hypothetical protein
METLDAFRKTILRQINGYFQGYVDFWDHWFSKGSDRFHGMIGYGLSWIWIGFPDLDRFSGLEWLSGLGLERFSGLGSRWFFRGFGRFFRIWTWMVFSADRKFSADLDGFFWTWIWFFRTWMDVGWFQGYLEGYRSGICALN